MPTLCGLAQIPVPQSCAGRDLSTHITAATEAQSQPQLIMHISKDNASGAQSHPAPIFRGLRTQNFTYALFPDGSEWLYDLRNDPYQLENLGATESHNAKRAELRNTLKHLLKQADDPFKLETTNGHE